MSDQRPILIYEHETLIAGRVYEGTEFKQTHFKALAKYLSTNPGCVFYTLYCDRIKFNQYVGVIRVDDLTIEVLPKTDRHKLEKSSWQNVLINMLAVSLKVAAQTTMEANIQIRKHSVLETYLHHFLDQVEIQIHHGLVKKYRTSISNQNALKGKLLFHQHITKNLVHAERFFVAHQVYDCNNVYNAILQETLLCIQSLGLSGELTKRAALYLLSFPECSPLNISEKLFHGIQYNRKTDRYKTAIELARIILLNYHPDVKGGRNNVLAIMFDMNVLWENYIHMMLRKACVNFPGVTVQSQQKKKFWQHPDQRNLSLKPDLILKIQNRSMILDTKWKYRKDTSVEDVRQMYAYGNYFEAEQSFLVYPDHINNSSSILKSKGLFYTFDSKDFQQQGCGLLFVDLLKKSTTKQRISLDLNVGTNMINCLNSI